MEELRRNLGFMLGWLASNTGHSTNPAYALLLSDHDAMVGTRLIESGYGERRAQDRQAPGEFPRGRIELVGVGPSVKAKLAETDEATADLDLDVESALGIALLDCEARARPVTANTLRSVEDEDYAGYKIRVKRRRLLELWTGFALAILIMLEAIYLLNIGHYSLETMAQGEAYFVNSIKYFCWGLLGSALYLLRCMSHLVKSRTFDPSMTGALGLRLLMGGVAGMLIAGIFYPGMFEPGQTNVESTTAVGQTLYVSAIAVLSGFGVRAVYAILEDLVQGLTQRFSAHNTRAD